MGRRYDEDERAPREWRGMRFLGGVLFGLLVCGGLLLALSMNAPNPLHGGVLAESGDDAGAPDEAAAQAAPARAPGGGLGSPSAGGGLPSPAPTVSAPGQPDAADRVAGVPSAGGTRDSAVSGDFATSDAAVALRAPDAATAPPPPSPASAPPESPGLQLEGPALVVNAASFDHDGRTPLVAVILSGAADSDLTEETLLSLNMPLTLALAPETGEAARLASEARLAGYEVVAQLPVTGEPGAGALSPAMSEVDLADRVAALLSRLWMSVGAMPDFADGVSADDTFSRAFIAVLERNGFAYVDPGIGEAGPRSVADAFGVPFVSGDVVLGPDTTADSAFEGLGAAADAARRNGTAVLRGPANRAMLEGLLRYTLSADSDAPMVAPLSAVAGRAAPPRTAGQGSE